MENELRYKLETSATPEQVWDALTNPDKIEQYMFGARTRTDWKVNSDADYFIQKEETEIKMVQGTVLQSEPGRYLEHTLFPSGSEIEEIQENYLTISYAISESENGTVLDIHQTNFAHAANGENRYRDAKMGWDAVLAKMKQVMESE